MIYVGCCLVTVDASFCYDDYLGCLQWKRKVLERSVLDFYAKFSPYIYMSTVINPMKFQYKLLLSTNLVENS
jgi:hypothetical protein